MTLADVVTDIGQRAHPEEHGDYWDGWRAALAFCATALETDPDFRLRGRVESVIRVLDEWSADGQYTQIANGIPVDGTSPINSMKWEARGVLSTLRAALDPPKEAPR